MDRAEHVAREGAVAIVGLACRLPSAPAPGAFWTLLRDGADGTTEVPPNRRDSVPPGTRRGGFLSEVDTFDAAFFGIPAREAATMDPQQRLALELGWEALEDARIVPKTLEGSPTGVFVGASADDYATLLKQGGPKAIGHHTLTGQSRAVVANRISYAFGLRGPSLSVDTGQSSSLVAVHLACEALRSGEAELALAGGVQLNLAPESTIAADRFGGLSPDGRCYTFDARANGYVRGEGGGFVVLKPLAAALRDGDRVHCVIEGGAVNNDGFSETLTTPSAEAQEAVIRAALKRADVPADAVRYVELHGTGTRVGDPLEAAALGAVFAPGRGEDPLWVGSVKTNIGHLEGAAGIAGLLKVALSLSHGEVPPSRNHEHPNPAIRFDDWRLRVARESVPWPENAYAGVSSFGMGGTNCHLVLSAAPPAPEPPPRARNEAPWVLSARTPGGLRGQAAALAGRDADPL
ncbi:polyketide synthase, partial [Amycolatopsis sp. SID8362]|uniref:beta-ketoacyl [acyl carrier protein] synthase domain-containing protein n=1 Tax=Amycolatopsis sp. SID8362 TaxID=2690346 RepID=UPI00136FA19C